MARVFLRRCDDYEPSRIAALISESLDALGFVPRGRTLVKPNTVVAHDHYFPHAYTRAELLDGLLAALRQRGDQTSELWLGERCGITVPTRYAFSQAGYGPLLAKHGARAKYFDEMRQVRRSLHAGGRLRDFIYIPEALAACDTLIAAPKLKSHPWTGITCTLKLNIGMQDDAHRLIDHDHRLDTKIADLFEVAQPALSVVDAIIAGQKAVMTAEPFPLGLIVVGDDALATDAVCARILGLDPYAVDHLRIASERGWGSLALEDVAIDGDVTLEQAQERAHGFVHAHDFVTSEHSERSNLRYYVGRPPEGYEHCLAGCPGSTEEALKTIERLQPNVRREVRRLHLVYGAYEGSIEPAAGERVLIMGDCADWRGDIAGETVKVVSCYRDRATRDPSRARSGDLLAKVLGVFLNRLRHLGKRVIRVHGCPISIAENTLYLASLGKTKNPYMDPRLVVGFVWHYLVSRLFRLLARLRLVGDTTDP